VVNIKKSVSEYMSEIGRKGGKISKRKLSTEDAQKMRKIRQLKEKGYYNK